MSDSGTSGRRVLLDEMLPRLLSRDLRPHNVTTVAQAGWSGLVNGELLRRAEAAGVEVFVTADRKMEHQQRLSGRRFGVVILAAGGTRLNDLRPLSDSLREAVGLVAAGEVLRVGPAST